MTALFALGYGSTMTNLLTRKLESFGELSVQDRRLLDKAISTVRTLDAGTDLIREGERPGNVHLILRGFAMRYKLLASGRRQIMAYLIPGDFCDLHVFILKHMDHNIGTLSPCEVVDIPRDRILELLDRPNVARALWWATLVDEATLREWLVNIGARPAEQRIAHLICEVLMRLQAVGLTNGSHFELPITQVDLGDTMGLTNVHVNRVLQRLRANELITLNGKNLVILDVERLKEFSGFNSNYLRLGEGAAMTRY